MILYSLFRRYWQPFFACLFLILVFLAYLPGLNSTYLLDDFGTLPDLGRLGSMSSYSELWEYVGSGYTGPTGRPVSLLSFALNTSEWPTEAATFLITNIFLHLLNAIFLFFLIKKLLKQASCDSADYLAFVSAGVWLMHPLHVSTVLYVVQRMTQLELLFNLLAVLAYLSFREQLLKGEYNRALLSVLGLGVSSLLAVLSKENAILIPLQLFVIEAFLQWMSEEPKSSRYLKWSKWLLIYIPCLVVIGYLIKASSYFVITGNKHGARDFTIWERLLTEFRVVGDYISYFFLPKAQTAGVFHDNYPISRSFFEPLSTFYWFAFHIVAIGFSIFYRKRLPVLAFGVLWFYINHILESTVIQLELKFEHRNYLPSIGLALVVAVLLQKIRVNVRLRNLITAVVFVFCITVLFMRTSLWGSPLIAAEVWTKENPRSFRAHEHAAEVYLQNTNGQQRAFEHLKEAWRISDNHPIIYVKLLLYHCPPELISEERLTELADQLPSASMNWQAGNMFHALLGRVQSGKCPLTYDQYAQLVDAALKNPRFRGSGLKLELMNSRAELELTMGNREEGVTMFLEQFKHVRLGVKMNQALFLAGHGELKAAHTHLSQGIALERRRHRASSFILEQAEEILANIEKYL